MLDPRIPLSRKFYHGKELKALIEYLKELLGSSVDISISEITDAEDIIAAINSLLQRIIILEAAVMDTSKLDAVTIRLSDLEKIVANNEMSIDDIIDRLSKLEESLSDTTVMDSIMESMELLTEKISELTTLLSDIKTSDIESISNEEILDIISDTESG